MCFCTLWGEQAAWRCWTTVGTRMTGERLVSHNLVLPIIAASWPPHLIKRPAPPHQFSHGPLAPSSSRSLSKLPHRILTSLHPLLHPLLHPAHLHIHTAALANNPPVSPLPPPPSAGPAAFHPHHHPCSSSLRPHSRTPRTDFLCLLLLSPRLLLSFPYSPPLVVQPGEHGEEESEDPAEEADPEEASSAGAAGERPH